MYFVKSRSTYAQSDAAFLNREIITVSKLPDRVDAFRRITDVLRYKWTLNVI